MIASKNASGLSLPVLGLGTWQMGGREERDPGNDDARDVAAIRAAIDAGITHIDTAEIYACGHAEVLVGQALRHYDRDGIFLASKVAPQHADASGVAEAAEASLRRLGTEHLDLYLLHQYTPDVELAETLGAMNTLVERGLVRHLGVCNFSVTGLQRAQQASTAPIGCNQVHYNLKYREPETSGLLTHCRQNDVLLSAWRPLQYGELLDPPAPLLSEIAEKYEVTPAQAALNWLLAQESVVTLVKTSSPAHLQENLAALDWTMEPADVERLRREFPGQEPVSNRIPLEP